MLIKNIHKKQKLILKTFHLFYDVITIDLGYWWCWLANNFSFCSTSDTWEV